MVVDPWGSYGGPILDSTIAHEFNHACQMADDWNDLAIVYEMTADYMQKIVVPTDENYQEAFADFQARPDWSLDYDDGYRTWYSYGSAMYLFYLRDRFFGGDSHFVAQMWNGLRGDPTFEDALGGLGVDFVQSTVGFARWRATADPPVAAQTAAAVAGRIDLSPAPMVLGSSYLRLTGGTKEMTVSIDCDPTVRWVVQAVPGLDGSDGETLDLSTGSARLGFVAGARTVIVSALPALPYDPHRRHDAHHAAAVILR
jgi:hypothetical protein